MLENSNLIEGQKAKEIDKLLKDYEDIKIKLADLDESKKQVLKRIFEIAEVGKNETSQFVFNVVMNKGRETLSPSKIKEIKPYLYRELEESNLVSYGEDYKTVRGVKLKGQRA